MNRYFTNADNANLIYFQFPKILMYGEKYRKMSGDGKIFYILCLDLIKLSMKNDWKDKDGHYYIKMSIETIQDRMNCGNKKAIKLKKELEAFGLIDEKRVGQGKSNRLYVLQLEYTDADIYKANNDHEGIENDEDIPSENFGALELQEKCQNDTSRSVKRTTLEVSKEHTIKNLNINTNLNQKNNTNNKNIDYIDDDKRTSPSGETSATHNEESINLTISNFREVTREEMTDRSFNAVIRKVVDKYNQGKITSFRDYLATALTRKIEELELRRQKDNAKQELNQSKKQRIANRLNNQEIIKDVPFYDWLNS